MYGYQTIIAGCAAALLLNASSVALCAQEVSPTTINDNDGRPIALFAKRAIERWNGERFSVMRLEEIDKDDPWYGILWTWADNNPAGARAVQAEIRDNAALIAALRARNVQINNVVAAQRASNGKLIFYLR